MTGLDSEADVAASSIVGRYRVLSKIGAGGMGDVYKAYDTQLDRNVALKFIRPELLHDREKVWRFVQEARAASALSHPAIVAVYEIAAAPERGDGVHYIAMELIDGMSLRQYFRERPRLAKLLDIVAGVANGMAAAHAAGVVHRDLKPDNIMITKDGMPKIVDFGLAKLIQPEVLPHGEDGPPTLTLPHSNTGVVMGTVGYMSPEQVEGKAIDHRSDIFSLGCILYEAITGRNPFGGTSVVAVMHEILTAQPAPIAESNPEAPAPLDRIVRRCLAKDREERYQSIKEIAIELRELTGEPPAATPRSVAKYRRLTIAAVAVSVLSIAAIAALVAYERSRPSELQPYRFTPFATDAVYEGFPSWSPDGKSIAYAAEVNGLLQVFVRDLDSAQATQITHAVRDCREPFWDPRGDRIFYISLAQDRDSLWSVSVAGGEPEVLMMNVYTAAISADRKMLAMLREDQEPGNFTLSLWFSTPPGSPPTRYEQPPLGRAQFSTGFIRFAPDSTKLAMWTSSRDGPERRTAREIWIVPRDGAPHPVLRSLQPAPHPYPFSWMPDSRHLVFGAEYLLPAAGTHLWEADTETGRSWPLTRTGGSEYYPSVSPDGKRIIFSTEEDDFDLVRIAMDGSRTPFLATSRSEKDPAWSPTRDEYAYVTNRSGLPEIWLASGNGQWRRPVVTGKDFPSDPTFLLANLSFSPDGQRIAYQRRGNHNYHVWISPVAGGSPVGATDNVTHYEDRPTWSPDGNWIAFTESDSRRRKFRLAKTKPGMHSPSVSIKEGIVYPSNSQWSPRGDWITVDTPEGFSIVSPDGAKTRVLTQESLIVHAWSSDGKTIFGIQLDENLHLTLTRLDIETGQQTFIADLGASAPMIDPVEGFSLAADGKSFLTSTPHLKSDLWILEGFNEPRSRWERLFSKR